MPAEFVQCLLQTSQLLFGLVRLGVDDAIDVEKVETGLLVAGVPNTLDGLRPRGAGVLAEHAGDCAFCVGDLALPPAVYVGPVEQNVCRLAHHGRVGLTCRLGVERDPVAPGRPPNLPERVCGCPAAKLREADARPRTGDPSLRALIACRPRSREVPWRRGISSNPLAASIEVHGPVSNQTALVPVSNQTALVRVHRDAILDPGDVVVDG